MTWFDNSLNETEAAKEHVAFFVAVDFDFPSGHVRVWTGVGDLTFGGYTYTGVGDLGKVSSAPENNRLVAERKTYQLAGAPVDPALVDETDIDGSFGRTVTEYFGFLDKNGVLVDDPEINWEGRIDQIARVDGENPIIEVNAEHRLIVLDEASGDRFTDEHQQRLFPGDTFFDQISTIENKVVVWGGQKAEVGTVYSDPNADYGVN